MLFSLLSVNTKTVYHMVKPVNLSGRQPFYNPQTVSFLHQLLVKYFPFLKFPKAQSIMQSVSLSLPELKCIWPYEKSTPANVYKIPYRT